MTDALIDTVLDMLDGDTGVSEEVESLVLAALIDDIDGVIEHQSKPRRPPREQQEKREAKGAWLRGLTVAGFRGIGPAARLELSAGPGLTIVSGRNGSGKSSFAEGLELLLTGQSQRWMNRTKVWQSGWQNLHAEGTTRITAALAIDGIPGAPTLLGEWAAGADPSDRSLDLVEGAIGVTRASDLGWNEALSTWRPFLSYNEIGALIEDGPSRLHDTLAGVLGLELLGDAVRRLDAARKALRDDAKGTKSELSLILQELDSLEDERATACLEALSGRNWDIKKVEDTLVGKVEPAEEERILGQLVDLDPLSQEALDGAVEDLRLAAVQRTASRDRDAELSDKASRLLRVAVSWFDLTGEPAVDCPVCGTTTILDSAWREQAEASAEQLETTANAVTEAERKMREAIQKAVQLGNRQLALDANAVRRLGLDPSDLEAAWASFVEGSSENPEVLAAHLESVGDRVIKAASSLRTAATELRSERANVWLPAAQLLSAWVPKARRVVRGRKEQKSLKAAADWIGSVEESLRNERFQPIKESVQGIWDLLKTQSSVSLDDLRFAGSRTRRKVEMDVSIDGKPGVAIGVMSQGELHALSLSLFLPRTMLSESPFRFLFIDDPVQAMDPAKVDGLARVLARAAEKRQVVVFSHDDRLPAAIRRLGLPATLLEVHRREQSEVEVRQCLDPVSRLLNDARAIEYDQNLPGEVKFRVIPGLCREAIETAIIEFVRRRRLEQGDPHSEVEGLLVEPRSLVNALSLALFDDDRRGSDVYAELNAKAQRYGPQAVKVVRACNQGSHEGYPGAGAEFIKAVSFLAEGLGQ